MTFAPDFGLKVISMGAPPDMMVHLVPFCLDHISVVKPGQFTTIRNMEFEGEPHAVSLDFDFDIVQELIAQCPQQLASMLQTQLIEHPQQGHTFEFPEVLEVSIKAQLGKQQTGSGEQFVPLIIQSVQIMNQDSEPTAPTPSASKKPSAASMPSIAQRLSKRATRAAAIVEVCEQEQIEYIPLLLEPLANLTWAEVETIKPVLPLLGSPAVPSLCSLLDSERKQTAEVVTYSLGAIGDSAACAPLIAMMEAQASQANAIRARDALLTIGDGAVPALIVALKSKNWQVRYYAVQALAVIGNRAAVTPLARIMSDDRSEKVRDAAMEALQLISYVERNDTYVTYRGCSNPMLTYPNPIISADWDVDIVNSSQPVAIWTFDLVTLQQALPTTPERACARAVLEAYRGIDETTSEFEARVGSESERHDVMILMGRESATEDSPAKFKVALAGLAPYIRSEEMTWENLLAFIGMELEDLPVPSTFSVEKSVDLELEPYMHLESPQNMFIYDTDGTHRPSDRMEDSQNHYGTKSMFGFAKAVIDRSWYIRENLAWMHEIDLFKHIPAPTDKQPWPGQVEA